MRSNVSIINLSTLTSCILFRKLSPVPMFSKSFFFPFLLYQVPYIWFHVADFQSVMYLFCLFSLPIQLVWSQGMPAGIGRSVTRISCGNKIEREVLCGYLGMTPKSKWRPQQISRGRSEDEIEYCISGAVGLSSAYMWPWEKLYLSKQGVSASVGVFDNGTI